MWHKELRQLHLHFVFFILKEFEDNVWGRGLYVFAVINSLLPPLSKNSKRDISFKFKTCIFGYKFMY